MKVTHKRSTGFRFLFAFCLFAVSGSLFSAAAQKEYSIAAIQGNTAVSPHDKESVRISGIVTAIVKRGFYVQTPDDKNDKDPKTSDGILVYGPDSVGAVAIGNLVQVDGIVSEFSPQKEKFFLSITEITKPSVKVLSKDNPLPAPVVLTAADLDPKGKLDQMERFESMRVSADVIVVAPTGGRIDDRTGIAKSDGTFFAVIQGTPRPFRESGIDIWTKIIDKLPPATPAFDMNPEMLRVNSQEQTGAKTMDVQAGATIKNLTGVIDYFKKFYTLLVDASNPPTVENVRGFVPVSTAGEREVTVGSFNIENFFDDQINSSNVEKEATVPREIFQNRLNKVSLAIRNVLAMPDVLGIVEVENLKVLQKIADKINADVVAEGGPSPKYIAYLEEGNDMRGIDSGFLVKSTKVKVLETKRLAKDQLIVVGAKGGNLFDRPPFLIRVQVIDAKQPEPLTVTVIVNHFKSYLGIDSETEGRLVREKRKAEAEWLANFVVERQKADPAERLILCGDFNAFQFNDGYNDLIGILKGKPDPNIVTPSKDIFITGLINLIDHIDPQNRYSYTFDGSAQALDHILVNRPMRERLLKFGYARIDADFPVVYSNDSNRPERVSDHDAPVVFLSLDELPPTPKPMPTPAPKP